ncbi:Utp14-domain-containing protein [Panus rudis PR-1116 ss-1]|nr:Utp14-domain-containing protein [Panus rudis PR-1116 ss-1]
MARAQRSRPERKPQVKTHKENNAQGYAKRHSLKAKNPKDKLALQDVYEYQSDNVRRSRVRLELEKEEIAGARGAVLSESEGDDEEAITDRRPRLVGEDDDDEKIPEDEDEEIDSDAAFEESDEERFAGFNFPSDKKKSLRRKKSKKPKVSKQHLEIDLNEDEELLSDNEADSSHSTSASESEQEEEEEGDPDDFVDVLDMLDGRGPQENDESNDETAKAKPQPDSSSVRQQSPHQTVPGSFKVPDDLGDDSEDENNEISEDEDSSSASDGIISASEDEDEVGTYDLQNFITNLDAGQKRKVPDDEEGEGTPAATKRQKRRLVEEKTEAAEENEFAARPGDLKLNLDDLLNPLASSSSNLQSLKKSAKVLASTSAKVQTLSAPLPTRTQERLDRQAAYEQTRDEVEKWSATMKKIREAGAEHLSFPLQAEKEGKTSNLELAAKFKPTTELESAVDRLLKSAKMRDEDIAATESLKLNHLSVEEVAKRRAELAKMRELMFRAEAKAKRVAKIKSKTYRRIKKKEKAKLAAKLGEGSDVELDEMDEETRMKFEVQRARERATLRHKNTGKWAKAMKGRNELDEDQRREITEMLDRGDKLRRRIQGVHSGDESEEDESDDEGDDEDAVDRIKAHAFEELAQLQIEQQDSLGDSGAKGKSIFEMKFMKDAKARDELRAKQMADDFVREMGTQRDGDESGDELIGGRIEESEGAAVQRVGGRVTYRPGAPTAQFRPATSLASDTSSITLRSTDGLDIAQSVTPSATSPVVERSTLLSEEPQNPWLAPHADASISTGPRKHEVAVSKTSAAAEKSKNKLRKKTLKKEEAKVQAKEDASVDITMTNVMTLGEESNAAGAPNSTTKPPESSKDATATIDDADFDSDVHSEVEEQERLLDRKGKGRAKGPKAFEQRELVARAFAGDNVVRDFAEAKRREMQEDAPKEVDTTLPGWGSWGGIGTKKAPPKPHLIKKIAGVDPATRADYKKSHVIISEKRDKKAAKYQVKDLPYPYTSKAQFERSMETPLGTEWNTRVGFQRGTLPRVVTKPGTVINPLEKLQ